MKALLISLGSRGDCEPFLAIGEVLRSKGVDVVCAFPEQYRQLAEEQGFDFRSLGSDFLDLMDSDAGRIAMGGDVKGFKKTVALMKIAKLSMPIQSLLVDRQEEAFNDVNPDFAIFHPKVMYAIPWGIANNKPAIIVGTIPYVFHKLTKKDSKQYSKEFNPLLCDMTNFSSAIAIKSAVKKRFNRKFSQKEIQKALVENKIIYTFSKHLFNKPEYWPQNTHIAGFLERNKEQHFTPSEELRTFIKKHPKILLATFGSIPNADPVGKTKALLDVVTKHSIPTIINISGGGFAKVSEYDSENILFLESVPYDYLLPKVYATIHHGGAGTLQSSLKAGCATMAIPHIADQPMWNALIEKNKLGPKGVSIADFKVDKIEEKILDLYTNEEYKNNAEILSKRIMDEEIAENLYRFIME